jgi:hypothetical protein
MPEVLFDDPLVRLTFDAGAGLLRYERSALPYPTTDDLRRVHDAMVEVMLRLPKRAHVILVDLRLAPPRNDDEYEATIEGYMDALFAYFRAYAILVKTAAGRLQVLRLERRHGQAHPSQAVFHEEAEALAYLFKARQG